MPRDRLSIVVLISGVLLFTIGAGLLTVGLGLWSAEGIELRELMLIQQWR